MKIKFPFQISQVSETEVEIEFVLEGEPLVTLGVHPDVKSLISDETMDAIYAKTAAAVVAASIKVSH